MEIKRDRYLQQLIDYQWDGLVKVITGIRRCGKSYLLFTLFKKYLLQQGIKENHIIMLQLDLLRDIEYRNPIVLAKFVRDIATCKEDKYYLFIDEIQMSDTVKNPYNPDGKEITFYDALNELRNYDNIDIYVTGSNSKMLSSDILTEFRGRTDEIRVHPLRFSEYYSTIGGDKRDAFEEYAQYGGMPLILSRPNDKAKNDYLSSLFSEVYLKDIVERKNVGKEDILGQVLDLLCSSVGSLTNPKKIADTIKSKQKKSVSSSTIKSYIDHLSDAFLFSESKRYDVKGKSYFDYPSKFYAEDIGLRNARIGFRQQEITHIMENIIYNELICRGYSVDVGVVYSRELNEKKDYVRVTREIDFVANGNGQRIYIQSAFAMESAEKEESELKPFFLTGDSFKKIIICKDSGKAWYDDNGILHLSLIDFLLDDKIK